MSIFDFIAESVLQDLQHKGFCEFVAVGFPPGWRLKWTDTARLFAYVCWYTTEIGEKNGLRLYRGKNQINIKRFKYYFTDAPDIDRTLFTDWRNGTINKPKGAENVEKIIKKNLQKHISRKLLDLDLI